MPGVHGSKLNVAQLTGLNAASVAFDKRGYVAEGIIWAAQTGMGYSVSDYMNEGYQLVSPKQVERLPGGTFTPSEGKEYGVRFDFDPKADRVINPLKMVMMYRPPEVAARQAAEEQRMSDIFKRKASAQEIAKKTASGRVDAALSAEEEDEGARAIL